MAIKAWLLRVKGRVQGVGFRFYTERIAAEYDVKGYVKNMPDGTVEILAIAEENVFPGFLSRVKEGPAMAYVEDVSMKTLDEVPSDYQSFRIAF